MNQNSSDNQSLLAEMLCIADSKWVLGHWYAKIILNGRTVPDFSSMAGMAQDELGHTRATMNFLEQSMGLPEHQLEFARTADEIHSMQLLDDAPQNWADFVVTVYLAEHALWHMLEAYTDGSSPAVANLTKKFSEEGYFHRLYIEGWTGALDDEEKAEAAAALPSRLAMARQWFRGESDVSLLDADVRTQSLAICTQQFEESVQQLAELIGVDVPAQGAELEQPWDALRRRPQGSQMPARLWEYVVPTSEVAQMARRPLAVSIEDNIDLFNVKQVKDETAPFFDQ
jgi:1,2-phenylacetyl-CoA epoxidase catalytic subunit